MRLLVTGGAGFIGSAFVRHWLAADPRAEVVVLDALTYAGNRANLAPVASHPGFRFVHGDIADPTAVQDALTDCAAVVNFAAETHVDRSILDGAAFVRTDVLGAWVLAEAARAAGVQRFVQVSTDEVYGAVPEGASVETDPLAPTSPYAAAKAGGELLVRAAGQTFGLPVLVVRGANAYGPYQFPEKLIPLHITRALQDRPLPLYGDGLQRRQWTHVEDFVRGVATVLQHGQLGQVYNLGTPEPETDLPPNRDLSLAILRLLGKPDTLLQPVTDRPAHDRRYRVNPARLVALGWQPRWRFADGLAATVRWYQDHPDWWQPLLSDTYASTLDQTAAAHRRLVGQHA